MSFGLNPAARQVLNSVFLHECVEAGLDSAIVHASKILPLSRIDDRAKEVCLDLVYNRRTDDYDPLQELLSLFEGVKADTGPAEDHSDWPVDRRLSQRIIDGNRNGLEADLTEALESGTAALAIVNDILLEGMKVVGERFASGEMQLPFVLQSAETMKAAVAFLEPHMEKSDQGGKGTVVLATVKGDVHDIGKNLVDIILTNNGYEVVNLGIKIGINEMVERGRGAQGRRHRHERAAGEVDADHAREPGRAERPIAVGHPGPPGRRRADPHLRRARPARGLRRPALLRARRLRGAAHHGPPRRAEEARARTTRCSDARSPRRTCPGAAGSTTRRPPRWRGSPPGPTWRRTTRCSPRPSSAAGSPWGSRSTTIAEYLNLTALFRNQWGFRPENGENDTEFKDRVKATLREQLGKAKEADLLVPSVAYGHFAANAEGNDLVIWKDESRSSEWMRFTFPRQRKEPWLCIADFFRPADSGDEDFASFMLCTIGARASEEAARLFAENHYTGVPLPARPQRRDGRGHGRVLAPPGARGARVRRRGRADA